MNYEETIAYLAGLKDNSHLGVIEPINLEQAPPMILRNMRREHLGRLFKELGYRVGAEVGVSGGYFSRSLWEANRESTIHSVDPYSDYPDYLENYTQERMDALYAEAQEYLKGTGCVLMREYSMEAVESFRDGELDFVYIDANHEFLHFTQDVAKWSEKVRPGGIVSGHDFARYKRRPICHVKEVVQAWTYAHKINPWFVLRGAGNSSWFWVKR